MKKRRLLILLSCLIIFITSMAYFPMIKNNGFLSFDDETYVTKNEIVRKGLTINGIKWSFTTFHGGNWHPITWISHMLDVELFGLNPRYQHSVSLIIHILNSLLLFSLFFKMTSQLYVSFVIAILFAVHPLHVESVAWLSERKDLLCAFFWILTMQAYVNYLSSRRVIIYILMVLFFILGLMSKPMIVTLPLVLLLMDYWPLNRSLCRNTMLDRNLALCHVKSDNSVNILKEKTPLLLLAIIFSVIAIIAQRHVGALMNLEKYPLIMRIQNSIYSYYMYIYKTILPIDLAVLYPIRTDFHSFIIVLLFLLFFVIFLLFFKIRKKRPYYLIGLLWFLVALLPVIGVVHVGNQSMADRYMYMPVIGILIILVYGVKEILQAGKIGNNGICLLTAIIVLSLAVDTKNQLRYWENDLILFFNALKVEDENPLAHGNYAAALSNKGYYNLALFHFDKAIEQNPMIHTVYNNKGQVLGKMGYHQEALKCFKKSIELQKNNPKAHYNMYVALQNLKRYGESLVYLKEYERLVSGDRLK